MKKILFVLLSIPFHLAYSQENCVGNVDSLKSLGLAVLMTPNDFKIGKIEFGTKIDSILKWYGNPSNENFREGVNVNVKTLFYDNLKVSLYGYASGYSASWICCRRTDHKMPNGVSCGMNLEEVRKRFEVTYKEPMLNNDSGNGILTVTGPEGYPFVYLIFKSFFLETIVMWSGAE